jgi:hypothetical protein
LALIPGKTKQRALVASAAVQQSLPAFDRKKAARFFCQLLGSLNAEVIIVHDGELEIHRLFVCF